MSFPDYKYGTGLSNVGSYQVSGKPYLSGGIAITKATSPLTVEFPNVTRWLYISSSGPVKVGMSEAGVDAINGGTNYFTVDTGNGQNLPMLELKCTAVFLSSSANQTVDIAAGLTGIPTERIDRISPSGSNWSGSLGVG
tara:strand:+ start:216 stop:632 length:417 start_codon:yes stop_codon:yes gene_type:complete